jgi:hypothetical protein
MPDLPPQHGKTSSSFLPAFLGAFAAVFVLALGAVLLHLGLSFLFSGGGHRDLLKKVDAWQLGSEPAKPLPGNKVSADVGWWARTFELPKLADVRNYLTNQGIEVTRIEPEHYETAENGATATYAVQAKTTARLYRLSKTTWAVANDPDYARFAPILVYNDGLPAGTMWNTQNAPVVAQPGQDVSFLWAVQWDKASNTVTTDRLPFADNVFTSEQVERYQTQAAAVQSALRQQVQQIDDQVEREMNAKLAQVPPDPPKPELRSSRWGGDGSGEPTRSAERIGGGTLAGAAGGAGLGAAAGDAGMGAGIGAGVGLLGGLIYDTVSKNNDRKRYESKVAAENAERMATWRGQVRDLDRQRDQIKQDAAAEKDRKLTDLANRISTNGGRLDSTPPPQTTTISEVPTAPVPASQPTSAEPSGPIKEPGAGTGGSP